MIKKIALGLFFILSIGATILATRTYYRTQMFFQAKETMVLADHMTCMADVKSEGTYQEYAQNEMIRQMCLMRLGILLVEYDKEFLNIIYFEKEPIRAFGDAYSRAAETFQERIKQMTDPNPYEVIPPALKELFDPYSQDETD